MAEYREQFDPAAKHTPSTTPTEDGGPSQDHALDLASTLGNTHVGHVLKSAGVQRAGATSSQHLDESVARAIESRRGGGQPLGEDVRADMEASLDEDLSDVRVHTDGAAHELNKAVEARAFTTGNDVFFKQGTYDPGSSSGRQLLAHELTHVVQQRSGTSGLNPGEVSRPSDAAEQHAESVGRAVGSQPAPSSTGGAPAGVARQAESEDRPDEDEMQLSRAPEARLSREGEEDEEVV